MKVPIVVLSLMLLISVVSCKKDHYPIANGKQLKKIVQRWHDSLYYTFFKYDQDGRIIEMISTDPFNTPLDTTFISIDYNAEGKMLNYRSKHNRSSFVYAYTFVYDMNGRISQSRSLPTNSQSKSYGYDQEGRLVTDSTFYSSLNSSIPWGIYEYNSSGDVVKWRYQHYYSYSQKFDTTPVTVASYYNTANSLADLGSIFYHILHYSPFILSKHNVSHINYNGDIRTFTYEYYANGLIKKIIYNNDKEYYDEFLYE